MSVKQLQFELWQECNSRCTYCYLGKGNRNTPDEYKLRSLKNTLEKISDLSIYDEYDTLSYLGGEFFQGQLSNPEVREAFMKVMEMTAWLQKNGYIKEVWIYATMTLGDQKDLFDTLKLFDCSEEHPFWLLTSFDTIGRFHNPKMLDTWITTMEKVHELYPHIRINTTTILTGHLINMYLNGEFSFKEFMEKYHTSFFFKQCGQGDYPSKQAMNDAVGYFFPKRADFLKFLTKFRKEESDLMWDKLFNVHYRADVLYRNFSEEGKEMLLNIRHKDSKLEVETAFTNEMMTMDCGHVIAYQAYLDSDKCVLCDKHMIGEMIK